MRAWSLFAACLLSFSALAGVLPSGPDYEKLFEGYRGCFLLATGDGKIVAKYNEGQCGKRLPPCSTFEVPGALISLETGVATEGPKGFAAIGEERLRKYLDLFDYGNRDISGGISKLPAGGSLRISAEEQVAFLKKLYVGKLPIASRHLSAVKKLLVQEKGRETFSGKGAACTEENVPLAWFVGHLYSRRDYVFAANLLGVDATGDKAQAIVRAILTELALMPKGIARGR